MICPRCEGSKLERLSTGYFCYDCRRMVDTAMFCVFEYGDKNCGCCAPGTCNKTLRNCDRHGNRARFGGHPYVPRFS